MRDYPLASFTEIEVSGGLDVTVHQGAQQHVRLSARPDLLRDVAVEASGGRLNVRYHGALKTSNPIRVDVTLPTLTNLDVRAGVIVHLMGLGDRINRHLSMRGGSSVSGTLAAASLTLDLQGGAALQLSGTADSLVVTAVGGVQLDLASLRATSASLDLSGGVNASVQVTNSLSPVSLRSGSMVLLTGSGVVGESSIDNSSVLRRGSSSGR